VHPDDQAATLAEAERIAQGAPTLRFTNRYRRCDGSYRWLEWRAQPDGGGLIYAIARDITEDIRAAEEVRRSEESLRASLREREALLQEVHHRVKNNLQVISSLIRMQTRELDNVAAVTALQECQSRIGSIALIHEKLYQTDDFARVPFSEYAAGLLANIFEAAAASERNLSLDIDTDPVSLPVDKAIPCGLILNELVSNSLEHAFRGVDRGTVRVELRHTADGFIVLSVTDDGVGVPADFDPRTGSTLGVQLISTLVEQLRGHLVIERAGGTTFRVRFPAEGSA
jgi:two-component sensor histidine kinase